MTNSGPKMTNFGPKMFNFERGRLVNKQIEEALQEAEDVLNLVDVLARATGSFINSCGKDEFSENVSNWLFEKKQARTLNKAIRAGRERCEPPESAQDLECAGGSSRIDDCLEQMRRREAEIRERIVQPQFCSAGTIDFQNLPSSYYSSQLLSHHVSSDNGYNSARSRYLDQEAAQISQIRARLSRMNSAPAPTRSACDLVGPISQPTKSKSPTRSAGVKMSMSAGSYSNLRSCIAKSKSMFEDFAGPNNPNYKCPWERTGGSHRCVSRRY